MYVCVAYVMRSLSFVYIFIFPLYTHCFGVDIHSFVPQLLIVYDAQGIIWKAEFYWILQEDSSNTVFLFCFLGSGLSCIGPQESLSCLIVFCQNWEQLTTACCFSARWRLSWPSWRITLLFGTSFTCALTVSTWGIRLGSSAPESTGMMGP